MPMLSWPDRRKRRVAKKIGRLAGPMQGLRWLVAGAMRPGASVTVTCKGHDVQLRAGREEDARIMLHTLGTEFSPLLEAMPSLRVPFVIDAGGFIGTAAMVFARAWPEATVVTLEPNRENFEILARNVAPYGNIVPKMLALAAAPGRATLFDRHTGSWGYTLSEAPADAPNAAAIDEVECTTVEILMREFGFDGVGVLKLDIEGSERAVLEGPPSWLSRTEALCVELHDRIVPGCTEVYERAVVGRRNGRIGHEKRLSLSRH